MSYTGTVRCRYCYNNGHNRRSCPTLKAEAEKLIAEGREDHYVVRDYQRLEERKANQKRQCSYCKHLDYDRRAEHDGGVHEESFKHNKRTCTVRKKDIAEFHHKNIEYRKGVVEQFNETGFAPGALVKHQRYSNADPTFYFVFRIDWKDIIFEHHRNVIWCSPIAELGHEGYRFPIPANLADETENRYGITLVSPLKSTVTPPDGWIEDIECVKGLPQF